MSKRPTPIKQMMPVGINFYDGTEFLTVNPDDPLPVINSGQAVPAGYIEAFQTSTVATAITLLAAQGAGVKIYITDMEISNSSATPSVITLTDSLNTQLVIPATGGREIHNVNPISVAANTALSFTSSPSVTALAVRIQGYTGA